MKFMIRWMPLALAIGVIYFLAYFHDYDFGFSVQVNYLLSELVHLLIFSTLGYLACSSLCMKGEIKRPHALYVFAIIFFTAVVGVFNEARIDPEHGGHLRDIFMHSFGGVLGMVIWRLHRIHHEEIGGEGGAIS